MENIKMINDPIKKGDFMIDTEKTGILINGENQFQVVRCKEILDSQDLVWESLDGKTTSCDSIDIFRKVIIIPSKPLESRDRDTALYAYKSSLENLSVTLKEVFTDEFEFSEQRDNMFYFMLHSDICGGMSEGYWISNSKDLYTEIPAKYREYVDKLIMLLI